MAQLPFRYEVTYAGIPLTVVSFQSTRSRDVVVQRPSRGRGAQLSDRGQREIVEQLDVQLVGTPEEAARARDRLKTIYDSGESRIYQHPLDGQWRAKLTEFVETIAAESVRYSITLVEDVAYPLRLDQTVAGDQGSLQDVESAAAAMQGLLAELPPLTGGTVPDPATATNLARSWADKSPPADEIERQLDAYRQDAAATQAVLDADTRLEVYPASVAWMDLRGEVERFARSQQESAQQTFFLTVAAEAVPLAALLSSLYGAEEAGRIYDDVIRVNGISRPLSLRAGQVLRLPRREATSR